MTERNLIPFKPGTKADRPVNKDNNETTLQRSALMNAETAPAMLTANNNRAFSTNILQYPMNVGSPEAGHYIQFNINKNHQLKLSKVLGKYNNKNIGEVATKQAAELKPAKKAEEDSQRLAYEYALAAGVSILSLVNTAGYHLVNPNYVPNKAKGTKHLVASINLYMPPSLTVSYKANYTDTEIGQLAETGANAIRAFGQDKSQFGLGDIASALGKGGADALKKVGIAALDTTAPGAKALLQIEAGIVITPRMELMFEGIGRREFSFTFTMIPKSPAEAKIISKIVHAFKYYSSSDISDIRSQKLPETFDIKYFYEGKENTFLNKISTCYCNSVDVSYGGDKAVFYDESESAYGPGASPQQTTLALNFTEQELIGKDMIDKGY